MRGWNIASILVLVAAGCTSNSIDLNDAGDGAAGSSDTGPSSTTAMTTSTPPNPTAAMPTTAPPPPPMSTSSQDTGVTTLPQTTVFPDTGFDTGSGFDVGDTGDTGSTRVSFFADVAPIFQSLCAPNCHSPGGEWPVQDLQNSPYFALVGVASQEQALMNKVEPGSLEDSYLWHKINGSHIDAGGSGLMMPKAMDGQDPVELTDEQFDIIATWILDGAPNN